MLLYLALHAEGATVEKLADALLPDTHSGRARNRLWQSAAEARRVLGDGFQRDNDGSYQLDRVAIRIDIDQLDELLSTAPLNDPTADESRLKQALSLFRGEPLSGVDWPWAEGYVRHLRATFLDLLERTGQARLHTGDTRGAIDAAERGLQLDQFNEALWRLAMEADCASGLRDTAKERYERLRRLLDQRLGLEPESETRALYHELLGQR